jgi:hypothetical protein
MNTKKKIGFNQSAFNEAENRINQGKAGLLKISSLLSQTGIAEEKISIKEIMEDPKGFFMVFLPDNVKQLIGVVNEDALNWPQSFKAVINEVREQIKTNLLIIESSHYFNFTKGGLTRNEKAWDELQEQYTFYTDETERYNQLEKLADALNHFISKERKLSVFNWRPQLSHDLCSYFDYDGNRFTINANNFVNSKPNLE